MLNSLALVQPVYENDNSEFKPAVIRLKIDRVWHPTRGWMLYTWNEDAITLVIYKSRGEIAVWERFGQEPLGFTSRWDTYP